MNRIPGASGSLGLMSHWQEATPAVDKRDWRRPLERTADDALAFFSPVHYERNYAYPLLVWLHDDHGNERQLRHVMKHVSLRNFVAVAVRGTHPSRQEKFGYVWRESSDAVHSAAQQVQAAINEASERFHIHAQRVFVAGYRQGGTMALRLALRFPEWFGGVLSLCGAMPQGGAPLARVNAARSLPVMLSYATECKLYPESAFFDDLRLLYTAGIPLAPTQFVGECELDTEMLATVNRWIMQQVCG